MASRRNRKDHSRSNRAIFADFQWRRAEEEYQRERNAILRHGRPIKMSEVLLDFISPYRRGDESPRELQALLSFALAAWNLALLPQEERQEVLQKVVNEAGGKGIGNCPEIVGELIARKEESFAGIKRFIVDFELTMTGNEPHLSVMYTLT
jgi:hypothetical protein